ncbi:MAG: hypothetical protein LBM68_01450, partial [Bacteroidales bacterium]|nr:hypothetical protein [Bacteroidales bacterium]
NIFRFFILFAVQILILNNINILIFGNSTPYLYVMFFLMLPFETNRTLLLLLGFAGGLLIDFSLNCPGVHASASLVLCYVRPFILKSMSPRQGYDINSQPSIADYGLRWFLRYAFLCVVIHHLVMFFNLSFSFDYSFFMLVKALLNIVVTLALILLCQYFFYRK